MNNSHNYFLVNFEPWKVMMKKFSYWKTKGFKHLEQVFQIEEKEYLKICMIEDLQAFGNSLIELFVGKH